MALNNIHNSAVNTLPASDKAYPVTPSDTTKLSEVCRKLTCTTAGNAVLLMLDGTTITVSLVLGVVWEGVYFERVNATNTTAAGIVAYR